MSHMWADYYDNRKDEIISFESDGEENDHDDEEAVMMDDRSKSREPDGLFLVDDDDDELSDADDDMPDMIYRDDPTPLTLSSPRRPTTNTSKFSWNNSKNDMPHVNNLHNLRHVQPEKIKIYKFRTVVLVVLLIFGTGMALGFILREKEEEYMAAHPKPNSTMHSGTNVEVPVDLEPADAGKLGQVKELLVRHVVSNSDDLNTMGSPQWNAMHWITLVDEADLSIPDESDKDAVYKYVQRYVMALLYYATNGQNWEHGLHWLGSESICEWLDFVGDVNHKKHNTGVGCDADGNIKIVSLGKSVTRVVVRVIKKKCASCYIGQLTTLFCLCRL